MSYIQKTLRLGARFVPCAAVVIAALGLCPSVARATPVSTLLGAASGYAVVAINSFQFNGPGVVNGNVAVGQSTNFATPAAINGTVFESPGVPAQGNIVPTGGFVHTNLAPVFSAAQNAATSASALAPTQNLGAINGPATINGGAGENVIDVSGINLTNGVLTLNGPAGSTFIINDTGTFTSSNSDMALTGGLTPNDVLFNVTGNVAITGGGGNNFYGTILAPNSDIAVHDKTLLGEIIGLTVEDTSGFTITLPTTPEPGTYSIAGLGLLILAGMAWRRRANSLRS